MWSIKVLWITSSIFISTLGHEWIQCYPNSNLTPSPVYAGNDADGTPIYLGRARYNGDLLPAKVRGVNESAYISHNGQEIQVSEWEVNDHISIKKLLNFDIVKFIKCLMLQYLR